MRILRIERARVSIVYMCEMVVASRPVDSMLWSKEDSRTYST